MSLLNLSGRNRMLASAAVVALFASGAIGAFTMSESAPADAAAVDIAGLQSPAPPSFAVLVARVKPAVVSVRVNIENATARSDDLSGQMDNLPPQVREFFKRFGDQNGVMPNSGGSQPIIGQGSGFFISADGYIVTNNHVVENAKSVTITTDSGKTWTPK